jgi:hypothetical protein
MHLLREIATQAVIATAEDPYVGLSTDLIYRLLDVVGTANPHLKNPLNRYKDVYYFRPREFPLTGEEPIFGRFLILTYCSHDDCVILIDCADVTTLEARLLGGGGILNPFTSIEFAFVDFLLTPFHITYRGRDGSMSVFNKRKQNENIQRRETYENRTLKWLIPGVE